MTVKGNRKLNLLKSAGILSVFSLLCKLSGTLFRVYLTGRIGSEGIGLYQLVMSVYSLFSTFATAGFSVSVSRLAAEAFENPDESSGKRSASNVLRSSIVLSLIIGFASLIAMLSLSDIFAKYLLDDARTLVSLRILALSMPFMALSGCFKGYFIAARKISLPASAQLFEQLAKIGVSYVFISVLMSTVTDIGILCTGIVIGLTAGELLSFLYLYIFYFVSPARYRGKGKDEKGFAPFSRILNVVMPIAAGRYVTGLLHTGESLLIPYCFSLFGGDKAQSLSDFGLIRGMVIPMLFFPFAFLSSVITILIPEISRLNTFADKSLRDSKIEKILRVTFVFSMAAGGIFFFLPDELSMIFYKSTESSYALRLLALVTPFMYIETISDGILKSIGEQIFTLKTGILNSVSRILIIMVLIPKTGSTGYLWLLILSNSFAFFMCIIRLKKATSVQILALRNFILPILYLTVSGFLTRKFLESVESGVLAEGIAGCCLFMAVYSLLYYCSYKIGGFNGRKNL